MGGGGGMGGGGTGGSGGGGGRAGGGGRGGRGMAPTPLSEERETDIINDAMVRLKGKTLAIHSPAELAKAIRKIAAEP
jgi:hypothetical protein